MLNETEARVVRLWEALYPGRLYLDMEHAISTIQGEMNGLRDHLLRQIQSLPAMPPPHPGSVRCVHQVQYAHDLYSAAMAAPAKLKACIFKGQAAREAQACANLEALCWLLGHDDHDETLSQNIGHIESVLLAHGLRVVFSGEKKAAEVVN